MRCRRKLQIDRSLNMDSENKRTARRVRSNLKHRFKNLTIKETERIFVRNGILDSTFKWQRELNTVQFDTKCVMFKDKEIMVTKVIPLKYREGMPKYTSIYPHEQ